MDVGIQVLALMWIVLLAVALQWGRVTNRGASLVTWIALTVVTWWFELLGAFVALNVTLFSFGREVALIAAIAMLVIMAATPVAWAYGLRSWHRYRAADE
jgi:hypothetical protein